MGLEFQVGNRCGGDQPGWAVSLSRSDGQQLSCVLSYARAGLTQTITVYGADRPVEIWNTDKHNYDRHGELGGRPIDVICYLDGEPSSKADRLFWGTCEEAN